MRYKITPFAVLAGALGLLGTLFSPTPVLAETACAVQNWDASEGLDDSNTGTQGGSNRRFFGPCGLRVTFGSGERWLENNRAMGGSTIDADTYKARLFGFFGDLNGATVPFFRAYDESDATIFTLYFDESNGLGADATGNGSVDQWISIDNGRWQEIEVGFDSGELFSFAVNDVIEVLSSSTVARVSYVRLGDLEGRGSGSADFDEFDSRRVTYPSEDEASVIVRGDANANGVVNLGDVLAIRAEFLGGETGPFAPGQADCTGNGRVNLGDVLCAQAIFLGVD